MVFTPPTTSNASPLWGLMGGGEPSALPDREKAKPNEGVRGE
jgi:hypothetical protein